MRVDGPLDSKQATGGYAMDGPQHKTMFLVGHLRSERDALALGFAICALPKVETPPTDAPSVCMKGVHRGPVKQRGWYSYCDACGERVKP